MTDEARSPNSLDPRDFRALIVDTFRIYKERFFIIVAIVAVAQVPYVARLLLENAYRSSRGYTVEELAELGLGNRPVPPEIPGMFLLEIVSFILFLVMYGAVAHAVAQHIARPGVNVGEAYRFAVRKLLPMIGAVIMVGLGFFGITVVVFLTRSLLAFVISPPLTIFLVALVLMSVYAGVRLFAVLVIVLFEGRSPLAALKGSLKLVRGNWWWVFGVLVVAFSMEVIALIIYLLLGATIWSVWDIGLKVVGVLSIPIPIIAGTLLYFDLRVRSEGYGLDTLARELEVGRSAGPR